MKPMSCRLIVLCSLWFLLSGATASSLMAQEATPAAETDRTTFVPAPAECVVAPLPPEELELLATPVAAGAPASPVALQGPFTAPDGPPADPETAAAVTAVIRESWACLNGGDWARFLTLLTPEEVRQNFPPEVIAELTAAPPEAAPESEQTAVFAILDVEVLAEGRVGAFVIVDTAGDPLPVEINYQIAVETEEGWRLDDFICFSATGDLC